MRFLPLALVAALPLGLSGCWGLVGATAAGIAGPRLLELGTSYSEDAQTTVDAAIQFRQEQIERRRDFRALCHADVLAERQGYLDAGGDLLAYRDGEFKREYEADPLG